MKKEILENWDEVNQTTLDLLRVIPEDKFHTKPFKQRFKSFSWEFSCILTTRLGYIQGIKSRKIDNSCFIEDDSIIEKSNLKDIWKKLEETNIIIQEIIENLNEKEINYFGEPTNIFAVLSWLLQHEQFHFGKLLLYLSQSKIEIPKSLKIMWGEESFERE